jgi:hypothetical protein
VTPEGRLTVVQLVPPSVVTRIGLVPPATQSEVDPHDTAARSTTPPGTVWLVQVTPPSVVVRMVPAPTATHSAELGQETPESCGGGGYEVCTSHPAGDRANEWTAAEAGTATLSERTARDKAAADPSTARATRRTNTLDVVFMAVRPHFPTGSNHRSPNIACSHYARVSNAAPRGGAGGADQDIRGAMGAAGPTEGP